MPHLFLHLRLGGNFVEDPEGSYYTYLEDARREATGAALDLMKDRARQGQSVDNSAFEITNEAGKVLLVYPLHQAIDDTK